GDISVISAQAPQPCCNNPGSFEPGTRQATPPLRPPPHRRAEIPHGYTSKCDSRTLTRRISMDTHTLDHQTAIAPTALAAALCRQPNINAEQLRYDFMDILEGLAQGPANVETVGRNVAATMAALQTTPRTG